MAVNIMNYPMIGVRYAGTDMSSCECRFEIKADIFVSSKMEPFRKSLCKPSRNAIDF